MFKEFLLEEEGQMPATTYQVDPDINITGTSKRGVLNDISYWDLVEVFGEPKEYENGDGVRVEWVIEFNEPSSYDDEFGDWDFDTTIATIYDWHEDVPVESVTTWTVGGNKPFANLLVQDALDGKYERN